MCHINFVTFPSHLQKFSSLLVIFSLCYTDILTWKVEWHQNFCVLNYYFSMFGLDFWIKKYHYENTTFKKNLLIEAAIFIVASTFNFRALSGFFCIWSGNRWAAECISTSGLVSWMNLSMLSVSVKSTLIKFSPLLWNEQKKENRQMK